jgi:hypothetical protein
MTPGSSAAPPRSGVTTSTYYLSVPMDTTRYQGLARMAHPQGHALDATPRFGLESAALPSVLSSAVRTQ